MVLAALEEGMGRYSEGGHLWGRGGALYGGSPMSPVEFKKRQCRTSLSIRGDIKINH